MKTCKANLIGLALISAVSLSAATITTSAMAQDKVQDQTKDQTQLRTQDLVYGSQLMTQAERNQYRTQMRSLKTAQEREAFRLQHHEQMQERARAQGVVLPEQPLMRGGGPGPGPGPGPGLGVGPGKK